MRKLLLILMLLFISCYTYAQNLIVNPSFETYNNCPYTFDTYPDDVTINLASSYSSFPTMTDWVAATAGTPDYYSSCGGFYPFSTVWVPENWAGYQPARTGQAYAGFYGLDYTDTAADSSDYREYLETRLATSLQAGHQYYVNFYVSLANLPSNASNNDSGINIVAIDGIGALFTDTTVNESGFPILTTPSISNPSGHYITDTANWILVQGIYTANGGEQWLTIGNFKNIASSFIFPYSPKPTAAILNYLYIDDVSVYDLHNPAISKKDTIVCSTAFPLLLKGPVTGNMYLWNTGDTTATINAPGAGTYWVRTWTDSVYYIDTISIAIGVDTIATRLQDTSIICGTVLMLSGHPGGTNYQWSNGSTTQTINVTDPGVYWVNTLTTCTYYSDTTPVHITPLPFQTGTGASCFGENNGSAWVTILTPANGTYTYTWKDIDNQVLHTDANISTTDTLSGLSVGDYTVQAQGSNGCSVQSAITVPGVSNHFLVVKDTSLCPYDTVRLHVSGGISYTWTPDQWISDTTTADPLVYPTYNMFYLVYAKDSAGCLDTASVKITVLSAAVLDLPDSITLYPGGTCQINATGNCLNFSWFPPLGLNADNISNPIASPPVNTKYIVHAATEWGCSISDSINVYVDPNTLLAIPNAFSPGNGPNNVFKVIKRGEATLKYLRIFNRWGEQVFETSNIDEGWDGTFKGVPQPFGVYVFEVEAYTNTGIRFYKQGNVTLLR